MMTAWGQMTPDAWLWMGVWVVTLLAMVWLLVRDTGRDRRREDPAEILRARYARGEIDAAQYQQARALLGLAKEGQP